MGQTIQKATVSLGGVHLAATGSIAWKYTTGVHPHVAIMSVHENEWKSRLFPKKGQPLELTIINGYGVKTVIRELYILEEVASTKPHLVSFKVADRRWKWDRKVVIRDYNVSRRTGDKNFDEQTIPVDNKVSIEKYDYKPYSLQNGENIWGAKACLEDVLNVLEGKDTGQYIIDSLAPSGEFSIQNISLADPGHMALQRLLAFIPGTSVWVDADGIVRVFNNMDTQASDQFIEGLPPSLWDGDKHEKIDRLKLRPISFNILYERELEMLIEFEDDYSGDTAAQPVFNAIQCRNVIPTVFESTEITEYDYEENILITKSVPPGTWVDAKAWLEAHDKIRPDGSLPWTFKTLRVFWLKGDLEGRLVGTSIRGSKTTDTTNTLQAIQVLREHFRQTFMMSRRYMERIRDFKPIRVALLDPITGARMPSSVWGQMTVSPTTKGTMIASRKNPAKAGMYYHIDSYPESGENVVNKDPGPQRVNVLDRDTGLFRIVAGNGTYGTYNSLIPGFTADSTGSPNVPITDLGQQDDKGVTHGAGMRLNNGTNEFLLPDEYKFKCMVTIVPGAPNNKNRLHSEPVGHEEIQRMFDGRINIQRGEGPPMDIFIPAGEMTARYAWAKDDEAKSTFIELLGLDKDDPTEAGLLDDPETLDRDEARHPRGLVWVNEEREIRAHSRAVAAEAASAFINATEGRISTRVPDGSSKFGLTGNMSGATIQVDGAPSGKVRVISEFAGRVNPVSRLALMPESARKVVLGIVRFAKD